MTSSKTQAPKCPFCPAFLKNECVSSSAWQKLINRTAPTIDVGFGVGVFELRDAIALSGQRFYQAVLPAY